MRQGSIRKNFILNLTMRVTRVLMMLATFPLVSRALQPEGLGRVSFAESFVSYLMLIAQLGIPTYGIRACARVRDDREKLSRTVHELVAINLAMSAVVYLALIACMIWVPRIHGDWQLFAIFSVNIIMSALGMDWLYEGLEEYAYITKRTLTMRALAVALIFLLVRRPEHAPVYAGALVLSMSGPQLINLIHARKHISFHSVGDYRLAPHMKAVFVFFLSAGVTAIYTNLDKVMLGFLAGDVQVGYYSVGAKIKVVLFQCISALVAVLLPRSSYYLEHGRTAEHRQLNNKAMNYVILVAISLSLFFLLNARESILFLSGKDYLPAVPAMRIIMPAVGFIGMTNVLSTQVLIPQGKEKCVLQSAIAGAVLDVLMNFALIPRYGATGAAIGTLVAEIGVYCTLLYHGRAYVDWKDIEWGKIMAALGVAGLAGWLFSMVEMHAFTKLVVAALLFFSIYGGILALTGEKLTKEILSSVSRKMRN